MKIDKETLSKIAHLARLEIDEKDAPKMMEDMSKMISFVEKLNELDTEGVDRSQLGQLHYKNRNEQTAS